ncbi:MAG: HD-GYP domain-containing protein [Candidatus Krumholzibacteriota bacterium]|nr:HD-GYP domain-containing protein [Candidatus Krumholzibacteriota bacterium]
MNVVIEALPAEYRAFSEAVLAFGKLLLQRRLFPAGHPAVDRTAEEAHRRIVEFIGNRESVSLRLVDGTVCYLNFELGEIDGQDKAIHLLRETFRRLSVGEMEFSSGVRPDELVAVAEIFLGSIRRDADVELPEAWSKVRHVKIRHGREGAASMLPVPAGHAARRARRIAGRETRPNGRESRMSRIIDGVLGRLEKFRSHEGNIAGRTIRELVEREGENTPVILLLNSLKSYDDYTFAHSVNVAVISAAVARRLGMPQAEISSVGVAALLHDIGKLYVPRSIIHKAGRLTPAEWQLVKKHPVDGARILAEEGVEQKIRRVAYEHHLRFDGHGYPTVGENYEQLTASHIVRIADSYDALTTKRAYRKQLSPYEAIKLMERTRGSEFHPDCMDIFLRVLGNLPIGSIVRLNTGERAVVVGTNAARGDLPIVRLIADGNGDTVHDGELVDLNDGSSGKRRLAGIDENAVRDVDVGRYLVEA